MRERVRSPADSKPTVFAGAIALLACLSPLSPSQAAGALAKNGRPGIVVARGGDLCGLLGPGDFEAVGVSGAGGPSSNNTPPTDYYCVYAGRSGYTGGIEFDAFVADSGANAVPAFKSVSHEAASRGAVDRAKILGVDQALLSLEAAADPVSVASLSVRRGKLVFSIAFPSNAKAESQLLELARRVLQRGDALTR